MSSLKSFQVWFTISFGFLQELLLEENQCFSGFKIIYEMLASVLIKSSHNQEFRRLIQSADSAEFRDDMWTIRFTAAPRTMLDSLVVIHNSWNLRLGQEIENYPKRDARRSGDVEYERISPWKMFREHLKDSPPQVGVP